MHACSQGSSANTARLVAETVQYFITAMDAVKMKMAAVDEVSLLASQVLLLACFRVLTSGSRGLVPIAWLDACIAHGAALSHCIAVSWES